MNNSYLEQNEKFYCIYDTVENKYVYKLTNTFRFSDHYDELRLVKQKIFQYTSSPKPKASSHKLKLIQRKLLYFSSFTENDLVIREIIIDTKHKNIPMNDEFIQLSKLFHKKYDIYAETICGDNIIKLLESDMKKSNRYLILIIFSKNDVTDVKSNIKKIFGITKPTQFFSHGYTQGYVLLVNDFISLALFKLCSNANVEIVDRSTNTFVENFENT